LRSLSASQNASPLPWVTPLWGRLAGAYPTSLTLRPNSLPHGRELRICPSRYTQSALREKIDWEKHFRKLADLKRKHADELTQEHKKRVAEMQRVNEIYAPQIDRVCRGFAKAVGWRYEGLLKKKVLDDYPITFAVCHYYGKYSDEFKVTLERNGIYVEGTFDSYNYRQKSLEISLDEFTEEKLAEVFEDWYKEHCL